MMMVMNETAADLRARMAPSPEQLEAAHKHRWSDSCYVPLAFPGKEYGWWKLDTQVEHPAGVFGTRDAAALAAARHLNGRPGTAGYAWIQGPDKWSAWEEILPPDRLIELDRSGS